MTINEISTQSGITTPLNPSAARSSPQSSSTSAVKNGRDWKSWSECTDKEKAIIIKKIALVILVAALIAAAGATAGLSTIALLAVVSIESTAGFAVIGALAGTTVGIGVGFLATPYWAHKFKMHRCHKNPRMNSRETGKFLLVSLGFTTASAAAGAALFAGTMAGLHVAGKALFANIKLPDFSKIKLPKINFDLSQLFSLRNMPDGLPNPASLPTPPPSLPPATSVLPSLPPLPIG